MRPTLFRAGNTNIQSAAQAAEALRPLAGDFAYLLFAVGLIGAGFLAVPILTGSSAYAIAEVFGWKHGFDEKPRRAKLFYAFIIVPTLIGMAINFLGINLISALFWTEVVNGFLTPALLMIIMLVCNNKEIMADGVNGFGANALGWLTTLVMTVAAIALVVTWGK